MATMYDIKTLEANHAQAVRDHAKAWRNYQSLCTPKAAQAMHDAFATMNSLAAALYEARKNRVN